MAPNGLGFSGGVSRRPLRARVMRISATFSESRPQAAFTCDRALGITEIGDTGGTAQGGRKASARAYLGVGRCASLRGVLE